MNQTANVEHPEWYNHDTISHIAVVEDWNLPYALAEMLKYICRFRYKSNTMVGELEDLQKAQWFLNRYVAHHAAIVAANENDTQRLYIANVNGELTPGGLGNPENADTEKGNKSSNEDTDMGRNTVAEVLQQQEGRYKVPTTAQRPPNWVFGEDDPEPKIEETF